MTLTENTYKAFLIRCWREGAAWRFSIESIDRSQPRAGFATARGLLRELDARLAELAVGIARSGHPTCTSREGASS